MGSGTTCVAAKELGREYIGFELQPEYFEVAKNRIDGYDDTQMNVKCNNSPTQGNQVSLF